MRRIRLTILVLLLAFSFSALSCSGSNGESPAVKIAREWVKSNSATVSSDIARIITARFPDLSTFSAQIADGIAGQAGWSFPHVEKADENKYNLIVNCSSAVEIQTIGKYETSVNLHMTVNTGTKTVDDWSIDEESLRFLGDGDSMALISFEGWYIGETKVDSAKKGDSPTARIFIVGGIQGSYTVTLKRDVSIFTGEPVAYRVFDYDGTAGIMDLTYALPYATGERDTRGYFITLEDETGVIWILGNSYPPRLQVTS